MEIFGENQIYAYVLGILLTGLALVFSTRYTLSNIKRIWTAGKPEPAIALAEEIVQEDFEGTQIFFREIYLKPVIVV